MYELLPNSQRGWDFVDALPYLINTYLYNSEAAFIPVVYHLLKIESPENCRRSHSVFLVICTAFLFHDVFMQTQSSVNTHICFHKWINQYAKTVHGIAFSSTGTQRSCIEAHSVLLWVVGLGGHCLRLTNRGLQCTTELFL